MVHHLRLHGQESACMARPNTLLHFYAQGMMRGYRPMASI